MSKNKDKKSARRHYIRRSMRHRIKKIMLINSVLSNLTMAIIILAVVFGSIGSFGAIFSEIVAGDIVQELENPTNKMSPAHMDYASMSDESMQKWFHIIGNKFYFNLNSGFVMHSEEEMREMIDTVDQIGNYKQFVDTTSVLQFGLVYVEITYGDEVIFTTMPQDDYADTLIEKMVSHYSSKCVQPYYNASGLSVGTVSVKFNSMILVGITVALLVLFFVSMLISCACSLFISYVASGTITKSLSELQRKIRKLSEGEIESAFHTEIEVKKPYSEIKDLTNSTNNIIERMRSYSESLENHKVELEAQNVELIQKGEALSEINNKLEDINVQMKDILDNVGQGFIRFEQDLLIHSEYSKECRELFQICVANKKFSDIIYPDDEIQAGFVDELLEKILEPDYEQIDLYVPLLPDEVLLGEKVIELEYKVSEMSAKRRSMIVIMTDITEKRQLEEQMDQERRTLKMVVKSLVNRGLFVEVAEGFEQFMQEGHNNNWCFDLDSDENLKYIMRQLHTFKGNFSQFDIWKTVKALHDAESRLLEALDGENECIKISFEKCIDAHGILEAFNSDMALIKSFVGDDFMLSDDRFIIEKNQILDIERKMQSILSEQECKMLLPEIRQLRYKPIKEMFKMYPEYTAKLSERMGKMVETFEIEADDIKVDEGRYQRLVKSMVHVFRNAVDHGIELPDDRVEKGKELVGRIACKVLDLGEAFEIQISDDGAGMDTDLLRDKLLQSGYDQSELNQMSESEVRMQVFEDSFTTQSEVTVVSGRGVGLSAVRKEVERLGGHLDIKSEIGKGTTFIFRVPYSQKSDFGTIMPMNFMNGLAQTTSHYLNDNISEYELKLSNLVVNTNKINLNEMTALISLKGVIDALILISVNKALAIKMVNSFLYEPVEERYIDNYIEDVLAEVANTLLGNTLGQFDDSDDFLHLGIPAIITNRGAYVKYTDSEILSFTLNIGEDEMSIHMIQLEGKQYEEDAVWQEF